jgi:hypothetical protein
MTGSSRPKTVTYKCVIKVASRASVIIGCKSRKQCINDHRVHSGKQCIGIYRRPPAACWGYPQSPNSGNPSRSCDSEIFDLRALSKIHFSHFPPNLFLSFFINNVFSVLARSSFFESSPGFPDPVSVWNADLVFNVPLLQSEFYKI